MAFSARGIEELTVDQLRGIRGVFTDIDDTLTTGGDLTAEAYAAMQRLTRTGLRVVPITGRPAGWCDHIARMWPVSAVVGENGAFYFFRDQGRLEKRYLQSESERRQSRARLDELRDLILRCVPGAGVASDQDYRVADLAIDFCEDVAPLDAAAVDRIVGFARDAGATAKISSIHVNMWYGDFDKLHMTKIMCAELFRETLDDELEDYLYVGDSPNDAPMFDFFPFSVGVANVRDFADRLSAPPKFVTTRACGAGFCEIADRLLTVRESSLTG